MRKKTEKENGENFEKYIFFIFLPNAKTRVNIDTEKVQIIEK